MTGLGHVFVLHGDLQHVAADGVLIPTDVTGEVLPHWGRFADAVQSRTALERQLRASAVSHPQDVGEQAVRYVDSGFTSGTAESERLGANVRAALHAIAGDLENRESRRSRPLVIMPLFGVGEGGFDQTRGEALAAVLSAATASVAEGRIDVAVVCFRRSDFAALQSSRDPEGWTIDDTVRRELDRVARAVLDGGVVLFMGAGVSVAAGLPDFETLISELEAGSGASLIDGDLPTRAAELQRVLGEAELRRRVDGLLSASRHSLAHGLLASLRVREAITTNFDRLYESACSRPFEGRQPDLVPWERTAVNRPWLLKAHGDPSRQGSLVLTAESFERFTRERKSEAAVLRAMLTLSREILFVGYSLSDPNINEIIDEAKAAHAARGVANPRIGTAISVSSPTIDTSANPVFLGIRRNEPEPIVDAARRLEVLLDYLLWQATRDESSWLLDPRYRALLSGNLAHEAAKALSDQPLPDDGQWRPARLRLGELGRIDCTPRTQR